MDSFSTVPSRQRCLALIDASNMLPNIKAHSLAVCHVAVTIARALNEHGATYNEPEIEAAALLHDITKTRSLKTGENHSLTGAAAVSELGYHGVAELIRQHVTPITGIHEVTAAELVSYADKRVLHERVVTLSERFDYLKTRYGRSPEDLLRIDAALQRTKKIEQRIANALPGGIPEKLLSISGQPE
jgi:putative nucleotidyltransferase with HDIG domain